MLVPAWLVRHNLWDHFVIRSVRAQIASSLHGHYYRVLAGASVLRRPIDRRRSVHRWGFHSRPALVEVLEDRTLLSFTTLVDNGDSANRIDMVFLGDGYTANQVGPGSVYESHIYAMLDHFFRDGQDPYPRYENYFNIHRIDVVSKQSGADVPPLNIFRDTALDATYYFDNQTERLLYVADGKARAALNSGLAGAGFSAELRMLTVNDTRYGGGGGYFSVYSGGNHLATEVALHEQAHSFSNLADEYGGFTTTYTGGEPSEPNVTTSPSGDKWSHWLGYDQPGIGVIGAYDGGRYYNSGIYRPSQNSKMRSLGQPFDAVSREQLILDMYSFVDPLDAWQDNTNPVTGLDPAVWVDVIDPNVIQVEWSINGAVVVGAMGETFRPADFGLGPGTYTVSARAYDDTDWVRINLDQLQQTVSWTVTIESDVPTPAKPVLTGPQGNAVETLPTFTWNDAAHAAYYDLWVNNLTTGQSQVLRETDIAGTQFTTVDRLAPGNYQAWVRAFNSVAVGGNWSAPLAFTVVSNLAVPGRPTPVAPQTMIEDQTPTFQWTAADNANHYDLWVRNLTTGQDEVIRQQELPSTSFTSATPLSLGKYRFWVQALNADGVSGGWSVARDFTIISGAAIPGQPQLTAPTGTTADSTPTFLWSEEPAARYYDLWVNNLTTGKAQVIRQRTLTDTQYTPSVPLPAGDYRVWVQAINVDGFGGAWSAPLNFTITGTAPAPLQPVLTGPAATTSDTTPEFTWNAVEHAVRYDLWVNNLSTKQAQVVRQTSVSGTSYSATHSLPIGNYRAWVRAFNSQGVAGEWSVALDFAIISG